MPDLKQKNHLYLLQLSVTNKQKYFATVIRNNMGMCLLPLIECIILIYPMNCNISVHSGPGVAFCSCSLYGVCTLNVVSNLCFAVSLDTQCVFGFR